MLLIFLVMADPIVTEFIILVLLVPLELRVLLPLTRLCKCELGK
jgi:hypothetical protein